VTRIRVAAFEPSRNMRWPAGAFIISIASSPPRLLRSDVVQGEITVQSKVIVMSEVPIPQLVPRSPSPLPTTIEVFPPQQPMPGSFSIGTQRVVLFWKTLVRAASDAEGFPVTQLAHH
jgi:hypothetical protein